MMMEPDLSNVDAARSWLGSHYPNSNNQTGSPLYRYLKDELAKGHNLRKRETHLSKGSKGEFWKFVVETYGGNAICYPSMGVTIYPEFVNTPSPDTSWDSSPEPEQSEKRVGSEKAKNKSERSLHNPQPAPNLAQRRRRKPPTTARELVRIQKERLSTLRPRRNGKVHKTV